MGELGRVIELMQSARARYSTLDARITTWLHRPRHMAARHRWFERQKPGSVAMLTLPGSTGEPTAIPEQPEIETSTLRLRVQSPARWRIEAEAERMAGRAETGWRWWMEDRSNWPDLEEERKTNFPHGYPDPVWLEEIYDPALLIAELWLDPKGAREIAGREGIVVHGLPRPTMRAGGMDFLHLEPDADSYELVVDAERGVILRLEAQLIGDPMSVTEVTSMAFDEPIPDEVFRR